MFEKFSELEQIIGYKFKDIELLVRAFSHNSYAQQKRTKSYQRLEFLGDSIVDFVVAKYLFGEFPTFPEGKLTKLRSYIVSEEPLANAVSRLNLQKFILLGNGEKKDGVENRASVKSDIFEALTASIYIDSNDMGVAEKFVLTHLKNEIQNVCQTKIVEIDFKSKLNEWGSKNNSKIEYKLLEKTGPDHEPIHKIEVLVDGNSFSVATAKGKQRVAEQNAAEIALEKIKNADVKNQ